MTVHEDFEILYAAHAGTVFDYARRRTGPSEAEDVVSEVFAIAWRRRDDLPVEQRPWLLGVARRVLANQRRSHTRRVALHVRLAGEQGRGEDPPATASEPVLRALARLTEVEREALVLLAWEELTPREAAQVLGIRPGTFTVRVHRARRRFAKALSENGHVSPLKIDSIPTTEAQ